VALQAASRWALAGCRTNIVATAAETQRQH